MKKQFLYYCAYFFLVLISLFVKAQQKNSTINNFKQHIEFLANDSLEGRNTGTRGEKLAYEYIISKFTELNLSPKGNNNTYLQEFTFTDKLTYSKKNSVNINLKPLTLENDFIPLSVSGSGQVKANVVFVNFGIKADALNYNDYTGKKIKGKIVVMKLSSPDGTNPHGKFGDYEEVKNKVKIASELGAVGVIMYNQDPKKFNDLVFEEENNSFNGTIPVVFIKSKAFNAFKITPKSKVEINTDIIKVEKTGHNVLGFIDNNAEKTVVIGAHYDHLGHGESGGSLFGKRGMQIHNGADDNASGVAMMIELANYVQQNKKNFSTNFLFIAFSGEELGLFGSSFFVKNATLPLKNFKYMLNYDMVGRLDTQQHLIINGIGTSLAWKELEKIDNKGLKIATTESGIGPSDQTSFYLQSIPAIHFFTGSHSDYHKPSDDYDKINYSGMLKIFEYSCNTLTLLNNKDSILFVKTKEDTSSVPKFKVTLGIMPDYMYDKGGVKVGNVTEGKPAFKAGIIADDIITNLGTNNITDMMSYMKALSKFSKGDKTKATIIRKQQTIELDLEF